MKKRLSTLAFLFTTLLSSAQQKIINTDVNLLIDITNCVIQTDTGQNPKVSKIYSVVGPDSAVQTVIGNKPRLVNIGTPKALECTLASKQGLIINNSIKVNLRHSFSLWAVAQTFYGLGGSQTIFGAADGDHIALNILADGKVYFIMKVGSKTVQAKTQDTLYKTIERFTPDLLVVIYDETINGIGGIKIYRNNVLMALDQTLNGNTVGFSAAAFNVNIGFGIGVRNKTSNVLDQAFGGRIMSIGIYGRKITTELDSLYQTYTDTAVGTDTTFINDTIVHSDTTWIPVITKDTSYVNDTSITERGSLYGLPHNEIEVTLLIGQSNNVGSAAQSEFPASYTGIQWGNYTSSNNSIPIAQSLKYTAGTWGWRYTGFRDLAVAKEKPVFHIQASISGTKLCYGAATADWNVNSTLDSGSTKASNLRLIDQSLNTYNLGIQAIEKLGYGHRLIAIHFMQGESDADFSDCANSYAYNLFKMKYYYRFKLDNKSLPFITPQISVPLRLYRVPIRQGQYDNSDQNPLSPYYDINGFTFPTTSFPLNGDSVHYNGIGEKMLGDYSIPILKNY